VEKRPQTGGNMRETLSLLRLYHWWKSFWNGHYMKLIGYWGVWPIFADTWADFVNIWFHLFGWERGWDWSNELQTYVRAYYRVTPTLKKLRIQWRHTP
jgi:hypothetical protein